MATWRTPAELRGDPWVAEKVASALAEYDGTLLPDEVAWIREQIFEMLANDVDASEVLRTAHPKIGDESGDVHTAPDSTAEAPPGRANGRGIKE